MAQPTDEALVVDASVATKWHLADEEHADRALLLLRRFALGQTDLIAPDYIRYEVPSAITVATTGVRPRIQPASGKQAIEDFLALGLKTVDSVGLTLAAYDVVQRHGCSLYDALYLALAEQLGLRFITADAKLYRRLRHLPHIVWIGDYSPPET